MRKLLVFLLLLTVSGCYQGEMPDIGIVLDLHNKERKSPLVFDDDLNEYAQRHANIMARKGRMYHSDISVLVDDFGMVGENVAYGQTSEESVMDAWMNSSGHKANILNEKYSLIGIGVARSRDGTLYWCVVFAD